jgi:hypothetical protein
LSEKANAPRPSNPTITRYLTVFPRFCCSVVGFFTELVVLTGAERGEVVVEKRFSCRTSCCGLHDERLAAPSSGDWRRKEFFEVRRVEKPEVDQQPALPPMAVESSAKDRNGRNAALIPKGKPGEKNVTVRRAER